MAQGHMNHVDRRKGLNLLGRRGAGRDRPNPNAKFWISFNLFDGSVVFTDVLFKLCILSHVRPIRAKNVSFHWGWLVK